MKLWYRMIRRLEEIYIRKHKEEFLLRKQKWDEEFYECIQDIAKHPVVLRMKLSWKYELLSALPSCILLQLCVVPLFSSGCKISGKRRDAA